MVAQSVSRGAACSVQAELMESRRSYVLMDALRVGYFMGSFLTDASKVVDREGADGLSRSDQQRQ